MIGNTGRKLLDELLITALVSDRGRLSISNTFKERVLVYVLLLLVTLVVENAFALLLQVDECMMMVVANTTATAVAADDLSCALFMLQCRHIPPVVVQ